MSLSHTEWAEALQNGDLLGVTCTGCETTYGTPFAVCNECGGLDMETIVLDTKGEVYAETTIEVPPKGFEGSYQVGIVQLDSARVMARLEGDVKIGDDVVFAGNLNSKGEADKDVPSFHSV